MLEKGFLKNQPEDKKKHQQMASLVSRTLLYLGMLILLLTLIYLIINIGQTDKLISMVIPFLVAGIGLILVSQFVKRTLSKLRR